jgi:uncharacterized protein (UPF0179 family)
VTTRRKPIVTLISSGQARVGTAFIHRGAGSKCEDCEYFRVCVKNLEPERVYEIVKVRERTLPCSQYEAEMHVVEVVDARMLAAIPAKQAIAGAVVTLKTRECTEEICENREICFPTGLKAGDRCEVLSVTESLRCSEGFLLKKAFLQRVPVS